MTRSTRKLDYRGITIQCAGIETQSTVGATPAPEIATVSWAVTAGATNVCIFTGTIKDSLGNTITDPRALTVYLSEDANGLSYSADSYSTGAAITDGTGGEILADKIFHVTTGVDGVFAISITDTGEPADQYAVAVLGNGDLAVSAASGTTWG